MNGAEIKPLVYSKRVGRPKKSRRKQPQELEGGTKLSKHGVKIQCSYCNDFGHNRKGCEKRKVDDLAGVKMPIRRGPVQVPNNDFVQHVTTQVMPTIGMSSVNYSERNSVISTLMMEATSNQIPRAHATPLPESAFISSSRDVAPQHPLTTTTIVGRATPRKRKATPRKNNSTKKANK